MSLLVRFYPEWPIGQRALGGVGDSLPHQRTSALTITVDTPVTIEPLKSSKRTREIDWTSPRRSLCACVCVQQEVVKVAAGWGFVASFKAARCPCVVAQLERIAKPLASHAAYPSTLLV